jgi:LEA14-like dessication related protein
MSMRTFLHFSVIAVAALLSSHCAHIGQTLGLVPEKPEITLTGAEIKSASFANVVIEVKINIVNQDKRDLKVDNLNFDLLYGESVIGQGRIADKIAIQSHGQQAVDIPVNIQTGKLLGAAAEIMGGGALDKSRIRGQATLVTWLGSLDIPFDEKLVK